VHLAILGAGPAGLGAAWWAAQQGHRVTVIERAERVGGATASFSVGGMPVDLGSHRLHPSTDPAILAALRGLLGPDLQLRQRHGRIRLADRWLDFPLRSTDLLHQLPPAFALRATCDAITAWTRRPRHDSFAEVVRAGLGPTMLTEFYGPYARKIWGLPPQELSGEQARRRIGTNSASSLLARLARTARTGGSGFYYPRRGFGEISQQLAAAATAAGAEIRLGQPVEQLSFDSESGVTVRAGETFRADRVWSTVPLSTLAQLAQAPEGVLAAATQLRFRAMVVVYVVLDLPRYSEFDAHYLPGPQTPLTRVSEPKNYRDNPDDPADRTVLCAELPCQVDDQYWAMPPAELGALVNDGLIASGLPAVQPIEVAVRRLSHAYPVLTGPTMAAFDVLDAWATGLQPQLLTFGRQGLFAHDNTHHALAMARAAVDSLDAPISWSVARESFARHVVED